MKAGAPDPGGRVLWGAGSSRAMRAHWALAELGLGYRREPIGARTGETGTDAFGVLNPRRKIPVLEDGDLVLTESPAIVTYLCQRYSSASAPLFPSGLAACACYYEWMSNYGFIITRISHGGTRFSIPRLDMPNYHNGI